jgi:hypothetical protein
MMMIQKLRRKARKMTSFTKYLEVWRQKVSVPTTSKEVPTVISILPFSFEYQSPPLVFDQILDNQNKKMTRSFFIGLTAAAVLPACDSFSVVPRISQQLTFTKQAFSFSHVSISANSALKMSDFDFPSAMPEKPALTREQQMEESADQTIGTISNALGEGVAAPPELEALKQARKDGAGINELALRIYELMIERGMLYDEEPETGTLTPTDFDIKEGLDIPEVKAEFSHLYKYGMMMMKGGLVTADELKETVLERLIKRTGMEPEEFDKWLGY